MSDKTEQDKMATELNRKVKAQFPDGLPDMVRGGSVSAKTCSNYLPGGFGVCVYCGKTSKGHQP